jgi:hypothetical protein
MKCLILTAAAFAGVIMSAVPANADVPQPGSTRLLADLGKAATTSTGHAVRCLANEQGGFSWMAGRGAVATIGDLQSQGS